MTQSQVISKNQSEERENQLISKQPLLSLRRREMEVP